MAVLKKLFCSMCNTEIKIKKKDYSTCNCGDTKIYKDIKVLSKPTVNTNFSTEELLELFSNQGVWLCETKNVWISVKDRLPENDDFVIGVWIGWDRMEIQTVVTYDFDEKSFGDQQGGMVDIQYWRELESTDGLEFDFGNN